MNNFIPIDEFTSPIEVMFTEDTPLLEIEKFSYGQSADPSLKQN